MVPAQEEGWIALLELEASVRGAVLRPNLLGALVGKASAMQIVADPGRDRHLEDFAVLASMLTSRDLREPMARLDCDRLGNMVAKVSESGLAEQIPGAVRGLGALRVALRRYSN